MDIERFETLALAYGGDVARWPATERDAAEAFSRASPEAARKLLADAALVDATLQAWRTGPPSAALRDRILATAPKPRAPRRLGRDFGRRRGLAFWLSGAGFAAAALAGLVVGVAASSQAVSDMRADVLLSSTLSNDGDSGLSSFTLGATDARAT
jgi:hypothetical protein